MRISLHICPSQSRRPMPQVRLGAIRRKWPGMAAIRVGELGSYQGFPWHTSVRALWEFDGSDRLANIRIQRIMDRHEPSAQPFGAAEAEAISDRNIAYRIR